jgi:uncharacterized protein
MTTAAALLHRARSAAGLSQGELARRAGVGQSVISDYESGRRQPALPTLERLVEATGHRLALDLERTSPEVRGLPDSPLARRVRRHRRALLEAVARAGGSHLRVFGSVARGEDGPDSDVDLLVDLPDDTGLLALLALQALSSGSSGSRWTSERPAASSRASAKPRWEPRLPCEQGRAGAARRRSGGGGRDPGPPRARRPDRWPGARRVRVRLIEIGEAVEDLPPQLLARMKATEAWPSRSLTTLALTPACRARLAWVCRRSWKRILRSPDRRRCFSNQQLKVSGWT